jgi:hypothetical protein
MITQKQVKETIAKIKKYQGEKTNLEFAKELKIPNEYLTDMYVHGVLRNGKYQFEILRYINQRELEAQL